MIRKVKKEEIPDPKKIARINAAIQKMSDVSLQYSQGKIKHIQYTESMDAIITASELSSDELQKEIEIRHTKLAQK